MEYVAPAWRIISRKVPNCRLAYAASTGKTKPHSLYRPILHIGDRPLCVIICNIEHPLPLISVKISNFYGVKWPFFCFCLRDSIFYCIFASGKQSIRTSMARKPREISPIGVYHVMLRGINKQRIFEWAEDYQEFYKLVHQTLTTDTTGNLVKHPNFELYAYCLMDNHVHLLLRVKAAPLATIIKRIATGYALYFNRKYDRVGHLFQDRFRSEPCNDAKYFLTLLDYIHNNPVKGGCCVSPLDYSNCSYAELVKRKDEDRLCVIPKDFPGLSDAEILRWLREMPIQDSDSVQENEASADTQERVLKESARQERSLELMCNFGERSAEVDKMIVDELLKITGCNTISEFQQLDKKRMRSALAIVRDAGVSIRRLSRLSGISEGIIRNCKNPAHLLPSAQ